MKHTIYLAALLALGAAFTAGCGSQASAEPVTVNGQAPDHAQTGDNTRAGGAGTIAAD